MDDLAVATVLMVVGGQLVLLRPRKVSGIVLSEFYLILTFELQSGDQEVKYDMQIFADRIEFCWIHLRGIGALENSLWGYDGQGIRVWLNALAIEASPSNASDEMPGHVKESVNIPLDFYPLCKVATELIELAALMFPLQLYSWTRGSSSVLSTRLRLGQTFPL